MRSVPELQVTSTRRDAVLRPAPLGAVGKPGTSEIEFEPPLEGTWKWDSDVELTFAPRKDWEVGREYRVTFARRLFPSQILLRKYSHTFRSPQFEPSITEADFYQDPTDPKLKQVVTTATFTHPVDKADFEKRVELRMRVEPIKSFEAGRRDPSASKSATTRPAGPLISIRTHFRSPMTTR